MHTMEYYPTKNMEQIHTFCNKMDETRNHCVVNEINQSQDEKYCMLPDLWQLIIRHTKKFGNKMITLG